MQNIWIAICNLLFNLVNPHSAAAQPTAQTSYRADPFNPATGQAMVDQFDSTGAVYGYDAP
ncbi:hypothetical protein BLL42_26895 (plasmid) [Pseudomonas frederiksbergensis]|uniref:Uncharacterized protein n=1 Tax=Pseudomonas frederiksbergensis TaxID=104087 RepID=A0A1J0EU99_9PSED|nr:hypothetical protein [Pseudomonas frederiksbergensis]APC19372.1 hypothetical protein BLL42_26895 [Pseudomonas frederiksbergensis]